MLYIVALTKGVSEPYFKTSGLAINQKNIPGGMAFKDINLIYSETS